MNRVLIENPTPWTIHPDYPDDIVDADGLLVASAYEMDADVSKTVIHCVNNHERLVTALKHLLLLTKRIHPDPHTYIIEAEHALKDGEL